MRDLELLAELTGDVADQIRRAVADLDEKALGWRPDPGANSIGVTVWHVARWLDVLCVRVLEERAATDELWHVDGWARRTAYDPRGVGFGGLGAITVYSQAEVERVPRLKAEELLAYLDSAARALRARLLGSDLPPLDATPAQLPGQRTRFFWVKTTIEGCLGHVGEIRALAAMRERTS